MGKKKVQIDKSREGDRGDDEDKARLREAIRGRALIWKESDCNEWVTKEP